MQHIAPFDAGHDSEPPAEWKKKHHTAIIKQAGACRQKRCRAENKCQHRILFKTGQYGPKPNRSDGTLQWNWYARASPHNLRTVGEWKAEAAKKGGGKLHDQKFQRLLGKDGDRVVSGTKHQVLLGEAHITRGNTKLIREEVMLDGRRKPISVAKHKQGRRQAGIYLGVPTHSAGLTPGVPSYSTPLVELETPRKSG